MTLPLLGVVIPLVSGAAVIYSTHMDMIKQKIDQTFTLLKELDIDLWLICVRETSLMSDPILPILIGEDATWQSFFLFSRDGKARALVGNLDRDIFTARFDEVLTYTEGAGDAFRDLIKKIDPQKIALNYSLDNNAADGLTHGMYLNLVAYLEGTPYKDRIISASDICSRIRSRKLPEEVELISLAAQQSCVAWDNAARLIGPGMTEIEIAAVVDKEIAKRGGTNSFDTIVNAGDKTSPGHGQPTEAILEPGDLLHVDFGMKLNDYCSDLQRLIYFCKPGEKSAPDELTKAFELVHRIISEAAAMCVPGRTGFEIDSLARKMLTENNYPEYQHALGHQLGRAAHDGGAIIGPRWKRYGSTPDQPLESGNAFTLELEIMLPKIGCVGLEEDVVIEAGGARFLCRRQEKLIIVTPQT